MRLIGFLRDGVSWMGRLDGAEVRPMLPLDAFYEDVSAALRSLSKHAPVPRASVVEVPPVPSGAKILCAGFNYVSHTVETKRALPERPDIFARWPSTLICDGEAVPLPLGEPGLDWEGELAAVIGREVLHGDEAAVEAAVMGFTCFNDLSARLHQRASKQWAVGKNADRSGPIGPEVVTTDEVGDPYDLRLLTRVDGEVMQDGSTADMLFRVGSIGAFASETMTLKPGDVICTGTPAGIGSARTPPVFLQPGQIVEVEIERLGILRTSIVAARSTSAGDRS